MMELAYAHPWLTVLFISTVGFWALIIIASLKGGDNKQRLYEIKGGKDK